MKKTYRYNVIDELDPFLLSYRTLSDINIKDLKVETIGSYAFYACNNLESIILPESLKNIETETFSYCNSLEKITFPNNLESIKFQAFYSCTNLKEIILPKSLSEIGMSAFAKCKLLNTIIFLGTSRQWSNIKKGDSWKSQVPAAYVQCSDGNVTL